MIAGAHRVGIEQHHSTSSSYHTARLIQLKCSFPHRSPSTFLAISSSYFSHLPECAASVANSKAIFLGSEVLHSTLTFASSWTVVHHPDSDYRKSSTGFVVAN